MTMNTYTTRVTYSTPAGPFTFTDTVNAPTIAAARLRARDALADAFQRAGRPVTILTVGATPA